MNNNFVPDLIGRLLSVLRAPQFFFVNGAVLVLRNAPQVAIKHVRVPSLGAVLHRTLDGVLSAEKLAGINASVRGANDDPLVRLRNAVVPTVEAVDRRTP